MTTEAEAEAAVALVLELFIRHQEKRGFWMCVEEKGKIEANIRNRTPNSEPHLGKSRQIKSDFLSVSHGKKH